ncbi:MAG: tryptophan synthase subunit beta [Candidatus Omnitrophica bacterium CG11_big_fil_rev_8_21_14_0_20_45_26]|uniref:Tryptophan synthase beta chain n=1 Tax=Candidatus Abzuiibacterium crystallinum TaxID=1974748 RepID=A0A2H0LPD9_9BACT|nr:MAG: tryptophan synthase subunit beta [Candidatus Omnitrophica bacterium CG11_big_fil_rev_8_21_14_0_20_45_26]PIW64325.1 MAG: tryptophan synthase subunit beta [Candidatus Omnitrophica bacterium CG12_big_fil_rev_8_21_14_0_65_45_16]
MTNYHFPDQHGLFDQYGGRFVPETLVYALDQLTKAYRIIKKDRSFQRELAILLRDYAGRPTPLYHAKRLSQKVGGAQIYFKREDLCHTGAHKINNAVGQGLLTVRLGKKRIVAETGAGQHGVAAATAARLFGLSCDVYMGAEDVKRQALNVYKMKLLGASVIPVHSGSRTLKDATNEAIRDWVTHVDDTHYMIGSVVGPHPYPALVRDFQSVIGKELKIQMKKQLKKLPKALIACVGGGSNAMGFFYPLLSAKIKMYGVEAAGQGIQTKYHAATLGKGSVGILHGMRSYLLQNKEGQVLEAHSISAGLDYPSVGPEHALLKDLKRVTYTSVTDQEAVRAFHELTRTEGIMPALETAHAVAFAMKLVKRMNRKDSVVICLSGRGDKDIDTIRKFS